VSEVVDKACGILSHTRDGNDLAPHHLYLVQEAVNGNLTKDGERAFESLYEESQSPRGYTKPWYCGVENLTLDHTGYVYWKGEIVEHFSLHVMSWEDQKAQAVEMGRRCRHLEKLGVSVNMTTAIWEWEKYENE